MTQQEDVELPKNRFVSRKSVVYNKLDRIRVHSGMEWIYSDIDGYRVVWDLLRLRNEQYRGFLEEYFGFFEKTFGP